MIHVEWIETALNEATNLWLAANSALRQEISDAMNDIDRRLARNPSGEGESRPGGRRIHFQFPLALFFRIEPSGDVVTVLHVWRYVKRKKSP